MGRGLLAAMDNVDAVMNTFEANTLRSPAVAHGFFTREGGVSRGIFATLNCGGRGTSDLAADVDENRRRVAASLNLDEPSLVSVRQVHGACAAVVERPWSFEERPEADAMVTRVAGLGLGILTADCAPVLFADLEARVVGAAHSGWKGTLAGVIGATVAAMCELGARVERIAAAIGPAIARESYEVDDAFRDRLRGEVGDVEPFFASGRPGHALFDLPAFVERRLREAGVTRVETLGIDTYASEDRLFSFRRATHLGEPDYGRQISVIALR